jgi:glycosyltransferase involved in cell wall biosynthesis
LSGHEHSLTLAPYGGDKINYLATKKQQPGVATLHDRELKGSILIAARANSYRKGFDLLIEAIQQLDLNWPIDVQHTLHIQICGDVAVGDLSRQLQALQKKLEGKGRISLHAGQLSLDAYQELLSRADLFVMPSRLEGSSPAALEALWTGVPAFLSEACGIDQFSSGRHGQLLHPNTAECLAKALMAVLLNPGQLVSWRKALQNDRSLFTWSNYLRILPEIIARQ